MATGFLRLLYLSITGLILGFTPQTVMLGGIPPGIQHGHDLWGKNLTLPLIIGEKDCDV